ncbi:MAG: DUF4476 domain-containing protein [Deltaproteobacteria bacterium]|nr:DUF4476 domain-containing protein [Deltaproteobacteria bacterium]
MMINRIAFMSLAALAVSLVPALASKAHAEHVIQVDRDALAEELEGILEDLHAIEHQNSLQRNPWIRARIERRTQRMHNRLHRLYQAIGMRDQRANALGYVPPDVSPAQQADPQRYVASAEDFAALLGAVDGARFKAQQLAVVREAAATRWFTTAQLIELMNKITFGEVDTCVALYPRLLDQHNFYQVYGHLRFNSDKDELRRRLGVNVY